jgi:TonB family protein
MDRKIALLGVPALLLVVIAAVLPRRCGDSPIVLHPFPGAESAAPPSAARAFPKKRNAPKKTGLVAPRPMNMRELQARIRKYYPEAEHRAGKGGHVMLTLVVGADGKVSKARVETSGGADFDEAALKVARAMRFSPARMNGAPVAVEITEGIDFEFDGK